LGKLNKIFFMAGKFFEDLRRPRQAYRIAADLQSRELKHYYFLFEEKRIARGKDQRLISRFDENGIPLNKTYIDVQNQGHIYFPISIGQMGLAVWHSWLESGRETDLQRFLKFADWFVANAEESAELGVRWLTDVPLPAYGNPGPWQSAFAQARGISILLRAFQQTGNKTYLTTAEKALIPFTQPLSKGGVTSFTPSGPFYEEYPSDVPVLVLNGMIFSLLGIYDFVRAFPEKEAARTIFDAGMNTLEGLLPEFDLGYWSRYNLCHREGYPEIDPATIGYQRLHATQLELLHRLSGKPLFKHFAERFREQDKIVNILRMYRVKFRALKQIGRL
jgi:hypothetical protein